MPWTTIQTTATSPMTRRATRMTAGGRWPGPVGTGGVARTSRARTKRNDSPTAMAAPVRYTASGSRLVYVALS